MRSDELEKLTHKFCGHLNKLEKKLDDMDGKRQEVVDKRNAEITNLKLAIERVEGYLSK